MTVSPITTGRARRAGRRVDGRMCSTEPGVGDAGLGSGGAVDLRALEPQWRRLVEARHDHDSLTARRLERALTAALRPLAWDFVRAHHDVERHMPIAENALRKALRSWRRLGHLWGFEEYLRGMIDAEIRTAAPVPGAARYSMPQ